MTGITLLHCQNDWTKSLLQSNFTTQVKMTGINFTTSLLQVKLTGINFTTSQIDWNKLYNKSN